MATRIRARAWAVDQAARLSSFTWLATASVTEVSTLWWWRNHGRTGGDIAAAVAADLTRRVQHQTHTQTVQQGDIADDIAEVIAVQ